VIIGFRITSIPVKDALSSIASFRSAIVAMLQQTVVNVALLRLVVALLTCALQGFWNYVVELMPLWLAPNLITWIGLCVNICCNLVLVLYNPGMKQGVEVCV
jgi:hypothetical protein